MSYLDPSQIRRWFRNRLLRCTLLYRCPTWIVLAPPRRFFYFVPHRYDQISFLGRTLGKKIFPVWEFQSNCKLLFMKQIWLLTVLSPAAIAWNRSFMILFRGFSIFANLLVVFVAFYATSEGAWKEVKLLSLLYPACLVLWKSLIWPFEPFVPAETSIPSTWTPPTGTFNKFA